MGSVNRDVRAVDTDHDMSKSDVGLERCRDLLAKLEVRRERQRRYLRQVLTDHFFTQQTVVPVANNTTQLHLKDPLRVVFRLYAPDGHDVLHHSAEVLAVIRGTQHGFEGSAIPAQLGNE